MKFRVVSSLLLGCLLVMTVQGDSSTTLVSADKEGNRIKTEVIGISAISAQKEPFERSGAVHHMRKVGIGGRKFMIHDDEDQEMTRRRSVDYAKNGKGITSKISGATYSDGICDFEREVSDDKIVKCKGEKSIKPTRKFKMDGFVAFTEDYHGPKHHLPKHN